MPITDKLRNELEVQKQQVLAIFMNESENCSFLAVYMRIVWQRGDKSIFALQGDKSIFALQGEKSIVALLMIINRATIELSPCYHTILI